MARRKWREQEEARRLRTIGWTVRAIATELGVSLSSASVWTSGIRPPQPAAERPPDPARFRCRRCHELKVVTELSPASGGRRGWCRACVRDYFAQRGDLHRRQTQAARQRRRAAARAYAFDHLAAAACADCGLRDPMVLEFDHVGPKRGDVSTMVAHGYSLRRLESELLHCEIVCANCHRLRTMARRARSVELRPPGFGDGTRRRNLAYVAEILARSRCLDCGERDSAVLEFDHIGTKRNGVTWLAARGYSLEKIEAEIAECEIRCTNCHRRRTHRVRGSFRQDRFGGVG